MHAVYERMQREGEVGPFMKGPDGHLVPRPNYGTEYPKWITDSANVRRIVKNLKEEIAAVGEAPQGGLVDPLAAEREKVTEASEKAEREREALASATSEMREELAKVQAMKEELAALIAGAKAGASTQAKPATSSVAKK